MRRKNSRDFSKWRFPEERETGKDPKMAESDFAHMTGVFFSYVIFASDVIGRRALSLHCSIHVGTI